MKLDAVRALALALPETTEAPHHHYTSFRVNGKIFATAPPEGNALHLFVSETDRERALALDPDCLEPLFWGGKVAGLRLTLGKARKATVASLLRQAWRHKAPARLAATLSRADSD
ncbi:MmcQ/YjbR family DNA-binding protein [Pseudomarimonas salicorniae]|uniref:MmcQ/YjbR family DNA-binding protein n=1 Tax=Pseudomarimonas salicorniae TaxID=2933270 RepID=A0ABT0GG05_9GAMM|nr:MmcQ/YjbR family DNA-binding protein [Lysobacter sp. CAU 1642]MCK7593466.1 MmcQ/YjbR family DNA-binding protein [Lysobacter sp. CAU 1642]